MRNTAFITGATGAIGRAITYELAKLDFDLILVARNYEKLCSLSDDLSGKFSNLKIRIFSCDVSNKEQVSNLFQRIECKLSVLINAAGISGGGITASISCELWVNVINTNLNGAFFVTREALNLNKITCNGRIINIASTGGKQGVIYGAPYCASKHGLVGFTKALGLELARERSGITVNAICPGFVESEMAERVRDHYANIWKTDLATAKKRIEERVPIGRYIEPYEVAGMVNYLVSPAAQGVTAQALNVCGGLGNY